MLSRTYTIILAVTLLLTTISFSQTYQGPAVGTVDTGAVINTNSFSFSPISGDSDPIIRGEMNIDGNLEPLFIESDGKEILPTTYTEDLNVGENTLGIGDNALLLKKFKVTLSDELVRLVIHGILHLLGYDDQNLTDKKIMKRLENKLLSKNNFILL